MKNKKKVFALALVLILALSAVAGVTIAYFTDEEEAVNTFTMGNVDITLDEAPVAYDSTDCTWEADTSADRVKANSYDNLYPGAVLPKDPKVSNVGSMDAYVRVTMVMDVNAGLLFKDCESTAPAWTEDEFASVFAGYDKDEWDMTCEMTGLFGGTPSLTFTFVREETLAKDEDTTLFTSVTIPGSITSEEAPALGEFTMDITADAIQATGFTTAAAAFAAFDAQ